MKKINPNPQPSVPATTSVGINDAKGGDAASKKGKGTGKATKPGSAAKRPRARKFTGYRF